MEFIKATHQDSTLENGSQIMVFCPQWNDYFFELNIVSVPRVFISSISFDIMPKCFLGYNPSRPYVEMHLYVVKLTACLDPVTSNSWYTNFVNEGEILTHDYIFISKGGGLAYCKLYKWIWRTCHGLQYGVFLFNCAFVEFVHFTQD
jgi:hypothetical protein